MTVGLLNPSRFGGAAPTFNPLTQVTALHAVWASDPSWSHPADGGAVSSWRNQSGGGDPAQALSGAQPLYRASVSAFGNKPALEFDGVDDALLADVTDISQPFKVLVVGRFLNPGASVNLVGFGGTTAQGLTTNASTQWTLNMGSNLASSTAADTNGHVFRITANSGSSASQVWLDGTSIVGPSSSGGSGAFARIRIGSGGTGTDTRWANCQIAYCGVYDGSTSDTDLAQLASDLKTYCAL